MSWKCPACQTPIRREADLPAPNQIYRCHICRLELMFDPHGKTLIVAPLVSEHASSVVGGKRTE
jgi:hypothetical protein